MTDIKHAATMIKHINECPTCLELVAALHVHVTASSPAHQPSAGMVMVPREPTEAMVRALSTGYAEAPGDDEVEWMRFAYRAMLAAGASE